MTQNIITAAEVREGDRIKVTVVDGDRINTHEGVANHFKLSKVDGSRRWHTKDDWTLWTTGDDVVIELLDRPGPKIVLPTSDYAVVSYQRTDDWSGERTAVLSPRGFWNTYDSYGKDKDIARTTANLERIINEIGTDFKVLFEGVAK